MKLKEEGFIGSTKNKDAVFHADMEKIQTSAQLDCSIPAGLQSKVFVDLLTYFCSTIASRSNRTLSCGHMGLGDVHSCRGMLSLTCTHGVLQQCGDN